MIIRNTALVALLGLASLLGAAGCQDGRTAQILELQRQLDDARRTNGDLESQLASTIRDGENARRRAMELQQMLDEARQQLASTQGNADLPAGWEGTDTIAWIEVGSDILFDSGKATVKREGRAALAAIVEQIQDRPDWGDREIWVLGHTDTDPITISKNLWKDNLDLSLNRAATVTREMHNLGIDKTRVVAAGQGEWAPKVPNDTKQNKSLNRRVQVITVARPRQTELRSE